jgi:hypothetical protein
MKKELLNGRKYIYNNENYCIQHGDDDIRGAEVYYTKHYSWECGFKIWFNGELIHTSKTFSSLERRLNTLLIKWHLELIEITETNIELD